MRLLVLTNMYPPHAYGGYELSCRDVVRRWRGAGHDVLVLTGDIRLADVPADASEAPDEIRRHLHLYWADHEILDPPPWRRWRWERDNQRALAAAVEDFSPEVVSAWAMGAMSLALLTRVERLGLPMVSVICDEWPVYGPEVDGWTRPLVRRPQLGRLVRAVTGLPTTLPDLDAAPACFVSEAMRATNRRLSPWSFPDSSVVPSGIDLDDFPLADGPGDRPWGWRLLHVGRIDPRKGLETVLDAFARCPPEATLEMLGTGDEDYLAQLRARADELGVAARVGFGSCPRSELARRYAAADAVVFAPVWEEPFGLVPLEAMASGTPVVASPTGGASEFLVADDNCVTFASGDAGGLAAALSRLAGDASLRRRLVEAGRRTAGRFTTDRLATDLLAVHRRAVEGHR